MRRGSVHWIDLEPSTRPEMGKMRPCVVISNSIQNEQLDSVVVVPLSTQAPQIWPLRIAVKAAGMKPSFAVIPAVRQVSKARIHERLGQLSASTMDQIAEAMTVYLSD